MPISRQPLTVKDDHIQILEVEINGNFELAGLGEEQLATINETNEKFERRILKPKLEQYANRICNCQRGRMLRRAQMRRSLPIGMAASIPLAVEQEDIDTLNFGVVISSQDGIYRRIRTIISRCSGCGEVHCYGDLMPLLHMVGKAVGLYDRFTAATDETPVDMPEEAQFALEDVATGKMTEAAGLAKTIFGAQATGGFDLEPVKPTEQ